MKKRAVATALLAIGVLGSACTGGDARARDAPALNAELAAPYRQARDGARGPAEGHAHHRHAHHAHGSSEHRTAGRAAN